MKNYPIGLFSRAVTCFLYFLLILTALVLFYLFYHKLPVFFLLLGICAFGLIIYYSYSEIRIDSEGIGLYCRFLNSEQKILWQDISEIVWSGLMRSGEGSLPALYIYNKERENIILYAQYVNFLEIVDEINTRFSLPNYECIKEELDPFCFKNILLIIAVLVGVFIAYWLNSHGFPSLRL